MASCGDATTLAKANAAIDLVLVDGQPKESTRLVPTSVVDKWAAALVEAHGASCVFTNKKRRSRTAGNVNGMHLYQFVLAGARLCAPLSLSSRRRYPSLPSATLADDPSGPRATLAARAPGPPTPPTPPPGPNRRLR